MTPNKTTSQSSKNSDTRKNSDSKKSTAEIIGFDAQLADEYPNMDPIDALKMHIQKLYKNAEQKLQDGQIDQRSIKDQVAALNSKISGMDGNKDAVTKEIERLASLANMNRDKIDSHSDKQSKLSDKNAQNFEKTQNEIEKLHDEFENIKQDIQKNKKQIDTIMTNNKNSQHDEQEESYATIKNIEQFVRDRVEAQFIENNIDINNPEIKAKIDNLIQSYMQEKGITSNKNPAELGAIFQQEIEKIIKRQMKNNGVDINDPEVQNIIKKIVEEFVDGQTDKMYIEINDRIENFEKSINAEILNIKRIIDQETSARKTAMNNMYSNIRQALLDILNLMGSSSPNNS